MAVPKFHEFFIPVMEYLNQNSPVHVKQIIPAVAELCNLTEEDKAQLLPSQTQPIYVNRIHWAISYLKKAQLIISTQRAHYEITEDGAKAVHNRLINREYVFKRIAGITPLQPTEQVDKTPLQQMGIAYKEINTTLADSLLQSIMDCSPAFFERLVVHLLIAMGYGDGSKESEFVVGRTGDGGIDGIINEDKLGFSQVYVQAKRWEMSHTVGSPDVQAFAGALLGKGANKGLFITTSKFSPAAKKYVEDQKAMRVVLVDGIELARLMIEYNVGVSTQQVFSIKRIDTDFFEE